MKVKVGISNRHIHITKEDYDFLFPNEPFEIRNKLSQANEFASTKTVTLVGPKNQIENVRVLGPFRTYTQAEITQTDSYTLGIKPKVKESGDLEEAEELIIKNKDKEIKRKCAIIANRHIHLNEEELKKYNLNPNRKYLVKIASKKGGILENVSLKVQNNYHLELHLDTDDANAFLLNQQDEVEIIVNWVKFTKTNKFFLHKKQNVI